MNPTGRDSVYSIYYNDRSLWKKATDSLETRISQCRNNIAELNSNQKMYCITEHQFANIQKEGFIYTTIAGKTDESLTLELFRIKNDYMKCVFQDMANTLSPLDQAQAEQIKRYLIKKCSNKDPNQRDSLEKLKQLYPHDQSLSDGKVITELQSMQKLFKKLAKFKSLNEWKEAKKRKYQDAVKAAMKKRNDQSLPDRLAFNGHLENFVSGCKEKFKSTSGQFTQECKKIDDKFPEDNPVKNLFSNFAKNMSEDTARELFIKIAQYDQSVIEVLLQIENQNYRLPEMRQFLSICAEYIEKCSVPSQQIFQEQLKCQKQVRDLEAKGGLTPVTITLSHPFSLKLVEAFKYAAQPQTRPAAEPAASPSPPQEQPAEVDAAQSPPLVQPDEPAASRQVEGQLEEAGSSPETLAEDQQAIPIQPAAAAAQPPKQVPPTIPPKPTIVPKAAPASIAPTPAPASIAPTPASASVAPTPASTSVAPTPAHKPLPIAPKPLSKSVPAAVMPTPTPKNAPSPVLPPHSIAPKPVPKTAPLPVAPKPAPKNALQPVASLPPKNALQPVASPAPQNALQPVASHAPKNAPPQGLAPAQPVLNPVPSVAPLVVAPVAAPAPNQGVAQNSIAAPVVPGSQGHEVKPPQPSFWRFVFSPLIWLGAFLKSLYHRIFTRRKS